MERTDEFWDDVLARLGVPGHTRTYVLGCLAQHVTFYSQQVRALNLIDALCNTGSVRTGNHIAVVGGGLAGMTAAAGALKRGLRVTLFEERAKANEMSDLMPLQNASRQRFVHPHIYDWPNLINTQLGEDSGLPLLGWTAGVADRIRSDVNDRFLSIAADAGDRFNFISGKIRESQIEWNSNGIEIRFNGDCCPVDVLILAVGFGVEEERHTKQRYWTDDDLDSDQAEGKVYLVSGTGDGGLTDLMRLCIKGFRHGDVLQQVQQAPGAVEIGKRLEASATSPPDELTKSFLKAADELNIEFTERETEVFVASKLESLFGGRASILNRLIAACLFRAGKFRCVEARIKTPVEEQVQFLDDNDAPLETAEVWEFREGRPQKATPPTMWSFDRVIVRHGPGRVESNHGKLKRVSPLADAFPGIADKCSELASQWRSTPHWEDRTRRPGWVQHAFTDAPPLDPAFDQEIGCVVVESVADEQEETDLSWQTGTALESLHRERENVREAIIRLHPEFEFESVPRLVRAVRALCKAPLAVFDISNPKRQPLTMVLLGVRAAARRGVTILTMDVSQTVEPAASEIPFLLPPNMPFNLKDCAVVGRTTDFGSRLAKAIDTGRRRHRELGATYQDLPVFDAVRSFGPETQDLNTALEDDEILLLSSFQKTYRNGQGRELRGLLTEYFQWKYGKSPNLVWINQTPSPELSTLKLYSALRHNRLCLVDWTGMRPNVFFELGVRLAVNEKPPICFHHEKAKLPGIRPLKTLFKPIPYLGKSKKHEAEFRNAVGTRFQALSEDDTRRRWPQDGALISPGLIYRTVRDVLEVEGEWFGIPIAAELQKSGMQLVRETSSPVQSALYSDGENISRAATRAGWDRLLAAWHFLDARFQLRSKLNNNELNAKDFEAPEVGSNWQSIGLTLKKELKDRDDDYGQIYAKIDATISKVEDLLDPL